MADGSAHGDVTMTVGGDHVAVVEMHRPPDNFMDIPLMTALADAVEAAGDDPNCRAIVLCTEGKHFCAGAKLGGSTDLVEQAMKVESNPLYDQAIRLAGGTVPVVAAVQGAAIGGGLGLALVSDFRVASPDARMAANFSRLGFHQGFGLSVTLPALVGQQRALDLLYTGRRVDAETALAMGLVDRVVPLDALRSEAHALAVEIAASAPLAVRAIRQTMRGDLPARMKAATDREHAMQKQLRSSDDFREGVKAYAERRTPEFTGR